MELIQKNEKYIAICTFQEKDIPKSAGFRWEFRCDNGANSY